MLSRNHPIALGISEFSLVQSQRSSFDIELQEVILHIMSHRPFERFCEMIDGLSSKAVLKAAAMERRMLEEDGALGRTPSSEDTDSILAFCMFLEGAARGAWVMPPSIPMEHWAFYEKTVERLAAAGELPYVAKEDFEAANHDVFFRSMA
jgi:hypothetical protein